MATINISSALNANALIIQQPAKFNFPLKFPHKFTIESININYGEVAAVTSNVAIVGTVKSITPISANVVADSSVSGQSKFIIDLDADLVSNSTIAPTVSNKQSLAPQTITSTVNIIGIETAIFKAITNIITNSAIAITTKNKVTLDSDLSINGDIKGNLINLIQSDLIQESEIYLLQTWEFPLEFPLLITDKQKVTYNIESDVVADSVISNNSIKSLLSVNFESAANINANISCTCNEMSTISANTNISANINSQLKATSDIVSNTIISSNVANQLKEISNIILSTAIQGSLINTILCYSDVISETDINSDLYRLVESDLISNTQYSKFYFPLNYPLVFGDNYIENYIHLCSNCISIVSINANIIESIESNVISNTKINGTLQADFTKSSELKSDTEINGDLVKLVSSDLKANATIRNNSVLEFPLTFPLGFNGVSNNISLVGNFDSKSQTTGEVQLLIHSDARSSSQICASISNNASIKGLLQVEFVVNDVISDTSQLLSNVMAVSNIAATIKLNNKLIGNATANSTIIDIVKNNIGLVEHFISYSGINAKISYLYYIVFNGIFVRNLESIELFNVQNNMDSMYVNYIYTVILESSTYKVPFITNTKYSALFHNVEKVNINRFSITKNVTKVTNIYETVTFNKNISSLVQIKSYKENLQFTNIQIKTKF